MGIFPDLLKKMLYKFHREYINCIWILRFTSAWLFMLFIEHSHCSLALCTFINIICKKHTLWLPIYNWNEMWPVVHSPTLQNHVKSSWPTPRRLERSCHSIQVPEMLIRSQFLDFSMKIPDHGLSMCTCIH